MALGNGQEEVGMVKIKSTTIVHPGKPLERKVCPLVTFDLPYVTFYYNQKLLMYKGGDFEEIVGRLKDGLAVALEYFYPLSGRLGKDEEGVLRVDKCGEEDAGVEVVVALAEGVSVGELTQDEASSLLQEIVPFTGVMNLEGFSRPLLAVQFNKLRDGLAIGCAFNHAILDGNATWHFMSAWAEICRGSNSISVLPFHDRTQARNTRVKLDLPPSAAAHENNSPESNGDAKGILPPSLRERIFRFSETAIAKIKAEASASLSNGAKPLSTFQSLGTHLWRAVTRARNLEPEDYTVFTIFMDCRKRVDPAMPDGYFGNLIQAIFTVTASGLLLANPPEFGAGLLQQAISAHDAKAIEARSREWESAPKLFQYKDAGINTVTVGSSPRFQVYSVDFGFGKPEMVRSGSNNKFDGMVYLYPGMEGGKSIDVEITLAPKAMEALENDKDFFIGSA